jgi:3-oxoacyl-[acyl-carrier-protein] synthase-3
MLGTGLHLPERVLSNEDLARVMDTSDDWIVQRTGIRQRRAADLKNGETVTKLATEALRAAVADARIPATELDMVILATVSAEMTCPSSACRVAHNVGAGKAAAFDLTAACSGWVYALNLAHDLIRGGAHRTIAVIGAETLTKFMDYTTAGRTTAILFGDGAGAAILRATDDTSKGVIAQSMHADGAGWRELFIPNTDDDYPAGFDRSTLPPGRMYMNGREVFKFAVSTFQTLIAETLDKAGLKASDIDQFVCHQSNIRILESARERFGIPHEKLHTNIDRLGNTSAASVPMLFDELRKAGTIREGQKVMFVAFGAGLTWGSSLWQF